MLQVDDPFQQPTHNYVQLVIGMNHLYPTDATEASSITCTTSISKSTKPSASSEVYSTTGEESMFVVCCLFRIDVIFILLVFLQLMKAYKKTK